MTPRLPCGRRRIASATAGMLGAVVLAGCGNPVDLVTGGDPVDNYCAALNADREPFAEMIAQNSPTALVSHLSMLQDLAGKAPDDIADDWQVLVTAVEGLDQALQDAGVAPSDYRDGKPPAGLDAQHRKEITAAADRLSSGPVVQAAGAISQEATDVCKINLGM